MARILDRLLSTVISILLIIAVVAAVGYHLATPAERTLLGQRAKPLVVAIHRWTAETVPFRAALRDRTPWLVVTPALVVINLMVFGGALFSDGDLGQADRLLAWGAAEGARTADGGWWRLLTATFVHAGSFHLLMMLVGIAQVASLLERLVGPLTVACVYVAAGAFGHAVAMSGDVTGVQAGAAPAMFGLYGLLFTAYGWGIVRRREPAMPFAQFKLLIPSATLLMLSSIMTDGLVSERNLVALATGTFIGFFATVNVEPAKRTLAPVAVSLAAVVILIAQITAPVHASVGVRAQLAQLIVLEDRTVDSYQEVLRRFTGGQRRIDPAALTSLIDQRILPQLIAAGAEVTALRDVTSDYDPLVASATEYVRLRQASWRLRAEGLRKRSVRMLQEADNMEQGSLQALRPLRDLLSTKAQGSA